MEHSRQVLQRAIEKVGIKAVAAALNLSPTLVYKWCEERPDSVSGLQTSGSINPLDRIQRIFETTQDISIINWICKVAGGFFVKDPVPSRTVGNREMFRKTQAMIKEFSDTLNAISQAYSDDSINSPEADRIRTEWEELKRAGETLVRECEGGLFCDESLREKVRRKKKAFPGRASR